MKTLCRNLPWKPLVVSVTLAAFICLSSEEEETKGRLPERQQELLFAFNVPKQALPFWPWKMLCLHAGSDPAPQEKLKHHSKGHTGHVAVTHTPAGRTAMWALCLFCHTRANDTKVILISWLFSWASQRKFHIWMNKIARAVSHFTAKNLKLKMTNPNHTED